MTRLWLWLPYCRCGVPYDEHGGPLPSCARYAPDWRPWPPTVAYMVLTRAADAAETAACWVSRRWLESPP